MGALLLLLVVGFGVYVLIKGILPYKGLKYMIARERGEITQNKTLEDIVELGTGVRIDTSELDK